MKLKKIFLIDAIFINILAVMIVVPNVLADTVTVYQVNGYYSGDGGEFTLRINNNNLSPDLNSLWGLYSSNTRNIGDHDPSFQSFCLEKNEYVTMGSTYNVVINDRAVGGGIDRGNNTPGSDPISLGTAYLYHQFQSGTLEGYDYNTNHDHRSDSAEYLQNMIWYLEDEQNSYGWHNPFAAVLKTQFGNDWATDAKADNDGTYPVAVLNLTDSEGRLHQDQLVCIHTPEPATVFLVGSGLIGLATLARRRFRK